MLCPWTRAGHMAKRHELLHATRHMAGGIPWPAAHAMTPQQALAECSVSQMYLIWGITATVAE